MDKQNNKPAKRSGKLKDFLASKNTRNKKLIALDTLMALDVAALIIAATVALPIALKDHNNALKNIK